MKKVNIVTVWWERVPKLERRAGEGSVPRGTEEGRGNREADGGGRAEGAR